MVKLSSEGEGIVVFGSAEVTITSEGNIEIFTANGAVDASGKSKLKIHAEATTESGDAIEGEEMEGQVMRSLAINDTLVLPAAFTHC